MAGNTPAQQAWRDRVRAAGGAGRHGTPYCAVTGCKRRECLDARNEYLRQWRATKKAVKQKAAKLRKATG